MNKKFSLLSLNSNRNDSAYLFINNKIIGYIYLYDTRENCYFSNFKVSFLMSKEVTVIREKVFINYKINKINQVDINDNFKLMYEEWERFKTENNRC